MKDPAFLFYSSDFITGVSDLTMEERGQFITLLCIQHQKGRLTKKAVDIAVPNATADVISKFTTDESGLIFNERLELEAKKRADHAEKQRQRAISGWKKRKENNIIKNNATAKATALPLEDENVNENISIIKDDSIHRAEILENYPFNDFWDFYDKKTSDKKKCEKKYNKLSERDKEQIFNTLPDYIKSTPDKQFRKNPETYLNNNGWEHEIIINNGQNGQKNGSTETRTPTERARDIFNKRRQQQNNAG